MLRQSSGMPQHSPDVSDEGLSQQDPSGSALAGHDVHQTTTTRTEGDLVLYPQVVPTINRCL